MEDVSILVVLVWKMFHILVGLVWKMSYMLVDPVWNCHGMEEAYRPECDVTVFALSLAFLCVAGEGALCL